ncbi:RAMP superfamily CRISPR-associated protein [Aerosakkonema funiforme]|uniref:RAMP superfamily CRISPR-associated protein n=1 Tax=Aerosakkonema funiforme TaxID=1246630 RepID=UPI0035BA4878
MKKSDAEIWQEFIQTELKTGTKIGKIFEKAGFGSYENKILKLYFADETLSKAAKGQIEPLKKKLPRQFFPCDKVECITGSIPTTSPPTAGKKLVSSAKFGNPLQALNFAEFGINPKGEEIVQPVLKEAEKAEATCDRIYANLKQRTIDLVGSEGITIPISFNWRVRVGGTRGFRELLLPVFHPVFGIPYIPASSLKGAARAWARQSSDAKQIEELLGTLENNTAKAAKVEFLDAFPTKHCLSVDVATPQWHWQSKQVTYKPEPHPLLSMEQPELLIGLRPTARGNNDDVKKVKDWLENALKSGGIGCRVSSGYGRALGQQPLFRHNQSYNFELWTQGMYGSEPPTKENRWQGDAEFRPTAMRGILRYWFRAVALGFYDAETCQTLEETLFGKLGQQGKISISTIVNPNSKQNPFFYAGRIFLEAKEQKYLDLISKLLVLASHLGGVGRGSRRPLHLLNGRMRGCHWFVTEQNLPLEYDTQKWETFFTQLKTVFQAVKTPIGSHTGDPGRHKARQQDVLDKNAQIWLLKSSGQIEPAKVKNWETEGDSDAVRGSALNLLYSSDRFKGQNQEGQGNPNVGGALETPSFVWIKSLFPANQLPYQAVTIFGTNHPERQKFAEALKKQGAILVFGQKTTGELSKKPIKK